MNEARAVVVMAKVPRPGRVKTRLVPPLSPDEAAALYAAFLSDVVLSAGQAAERRRAAPILACALAGGDSIEDAHGLVPAGWRVIEQRGTDLGARIEGAREDAGARHVVILGSDSPTLPSDRIDAAFDAIERVGCAVGPTDDGGYYAIAFDGPHPEILSGIPWSTDGVMAATRRAAAQAGIRIEEIPPWYDVDVAEDLPRALADARRQGRGATARAIERVVARAAARR